MSNLVSVIPLHWLKCKCLQGEDLLDCCEPLEVVKQKGVTFGKVGVGPSSWENKLWRVSVLHAPCQLGCLLPQVACLARCNGAQVEAHRVDEADVLQEDFRPDGLAASLSEGPNSAFESPRKESSDLQLRSRPGGWRPTRGLAVGCRSAYSSWQSEPRTISKLRSSFHFGSCMYYIARLKSNTQARCWEMLLLSIPKQALA